MCDSNAAVFKDLFSEQNSRAKIGYDRFVRTTEESHAEAVRNMWQKLKSNGYIEKGVHQGFYSTNEETFFMEKDLEKDDLGNMIVPHTGEVCELVKEENYVFKVKQELKDKVSEWSSSH